MGFSALSILELRAFWALSPPFFSGYHGVATFSFCCSVCRPEFWVGARSTDGYTWRWGNGDQTRKTFVSDQTLMYDCLALRGDGYLEPKPCWPVYGVDDGGVLCEKKVAHMYLHVYLYLISNICIYYSLH